VTTPEAIYKMALEHIRDGSDAVCTECGWVGDTISAMRQEMCELPQFFCPKCGSMNIESGPDEIVTYALAQGVKEG